MPTESTRAYRSHLQPACLSCRRRKSRCHSDASNEPCLMCRAHGTDCIYPPDPRAVTASKGYSGQPKRHPRPMTTSSRPSRRLPETPRPSRNRIKDSSSQHHETQEMPRGVDGRRHTTVLTSTLNSPDDRQSNLHIVGPAVTADSQVLSDYLSGVSVTRQSSGHVGPVPASRSRAVLFTKVDKRPLGTIIDLSPSVQKLETIERIIEPFNIALVDVYFEKVNPCFPILDAHALREQLSDDKSKVSPALLACLYAHSLVYWKYAEPLRKHHCPNERFIWNLANEAVYSELQLQPSISIIKAILLNVGGRPTTSLVGNALLLGAAVSMANSLGLNRDPTTWDLTAAEKRERMQTWWALLFHDRWSSLTHGTPPRISRDHYDVPSPRVEHLCHEGSTHLDKGSAMTFVALIGLTEVLDDFLQQIYQVSRTVAMSVGSLELSLNRWVESLQGSVRQTVVRGTSLTAKGAANLRLSYLTTRLLAQRIALEASKQSPEQNPEVQMMCLYQARQTSEEIVIFTRELGPAQLGDFWPSVSAFVYPATMSFLLRCALESCTSARDIIEDASFKIARDLLSAIQGHRDDFGWDVADLCLTQHSEIVDKILGEAATSADSVHEDSDSLQNYLFSDTSFLDQFFPSLWDPPHAPME